MILTLDMKTLAFAGDPIVEPSRWQAEAQTILRAYKSGDVATLAEIRSRCGLSTHECVGGLSALQQSGMVEPDYYPAPHGDWTEYLFLETP